MFQLGSYTGPGQGAQWKEHRELSNQLKKEYANLRELRGFKSRDDNRAAHKEMERKREQSNVEQAARDEFMATKKRFEKEESGIKKKSEAINERASTFVTEAKKTFVAESGNNIFW